MTLAERVEALPTGPGVYLFKSRSGRVLYIGKAQNLRSRVRSYVSGGDGRIRVPQLVERAADVDVVVTRNVKDALLLENELIKRHKPPFNVRLRDDKQYLALRLDPEEAWPRLTEVRRFRQDGAQYFGPYTSSVSMHNAVSNLRRIFPLRSCRDAVFRDYERRGRPCIEYEMKRCGTACSGPPARSAPRRRPSSAIDSPPSSARWSASRSWRSGRSIGTCSDWPVGAARSRCRRCTFATAAW